jgi:hypothetical protein
MRKITFLFVLVMVSTFAICQVDRSRYSIEYEYFGFVSQNPFVKENWTTVAASGSPWEIRTTTPSTGSGGGNLFTNLGNGTATKSVTYTVTKETDRLRDFKLSFLGIKTGTIPNLIIKYSTDGTNFNDFSGNSIVLTGSWIKYNLDLPVDINYCSSLQIRIQIDAINNPSAFIRIDDFFLSAKFEEPGQAINVGNAVTYLTVPSNTLFETDEFTAEAWIKTTAAGTNVIAACNDYTNFDGWDIRLMDGKMAASLGYGTNWTTQYSSDLKLNDGRWHHVAVTMNASKTYKYFADGKLVYTNTLPSYVKPNLNNFMIGVHNNLEAWSGFEGLIDEVRVWNYARQESEIVANYNQLINPSEIGLVAYFNFDQPNYYYEIYDLTPNAMVGTGSGFNITTWQESYAMMVPTLFDAWNTTYSGFTASWANPTFGFFDKILLDVSPQPDFAVFVDGYNSYDCGIDEMHNVTGLVANKTYYFRVRAFNSSLGEISAYSVVKTATTLDCSYDINFSSTPTSCYTASDGTATVTPTVEGTYTFMWSNSQNTQTASGFPISDAYATVTDELGCSKAGYVYVSGPAYIYDFPIGGESSYCEGTQGAAVSLLGSQIGITYQLRVNDVDFGAPIPGTGSALFWNNVTSPTNPGTTTVLATQGPGCTNLMSTTSSLQILPLSTINAVVTNVDCKGNSTGSINITAEPQGWSPYSYIWSNNETTEDISELSPNTYSVTVTNGYGCETIFSAEVNEPSESLSVTVTKTDASCYSTYNGTATATPAGGTLPYTYSWNTGETTSTIMYLGVNTTVYITVTDANGCEAYGSVTISGPVEINDYYITGGGSYCEGADGVSVFMNGSQADVQYQLYVDGTPFQGPVIGNGSPITWNNVHAVNQNSIANVYATQISTGCVKSMPYTAMITINYKPVIELLEAVDVQCQGYQNGAIYIDVTGNSPFTCIWNGSIGTQNLVNVSGGNWTVLVTDKFNCTQTFSQTIFEPTQLIATVTTQDVSCSYNSDGAATAVGTGGNPPYSYLWDNNQTTESITGLAIYTYAHVTVTDSKGCYYMNNGYVSGPPAIYSASLDNGFYCEGESGATINLYGSQQNVSYQLFVDGVAFGAPIIGTESILTWYNVTNNGGTTPLSIIATHIPSGCTNSNFYAQLTQRPKPIVYLDYLNDISCFGSNDGEINAWGTGGGGGFSQEWSNGATTTSISNLSPGNYTITVSDAYECSASQTFTIVEPEQLQIIPTATNVSCYGLSDGSINLSASGGTLPYTFSPAQNSTGLSAGYYGVSVTDANNCFTYSMVEVEQPLLFTVFAGNDVTIDEGQSTQLGEEPVQGYTYSWSPTYGLSNPNIANPIAQPGITTNYTLTAMNGNCSATDEVVVTVYATYDLSGIVSYDNTEETAMNNCLVTLYLGGSPYANTITDALGYYEFLNLVPNTYTLSFSTGKDWGGVNSTDALAVQNHYAGNMLLVQPYLNAGDVNLSNTVNATDALLMKRRYSNLISSFVSGDWYFQTAPILVDGDITFDVKALCYGDVNGSYEPSAAKQVANTNLNVNGTINATTGSIIEIPIQINNSYELGAVSLIINYPTDVINITGVSSTLLNGMLTNIIDGKVYIAWSNSQGVNTTQGSAIITLQATVVSNQSATAQLSLSDSEFADRYAQVISGIELDAPIINADGVTGVGNYEQSVISFYPNPTNGIVNISNANGASIEVYNVLGEKLINSIASSTITTVDLSAYPVGNYLIRIVKDGKSSTTSITLK